MLVNFSWLVPQQIAGSARPGDYAAGLEGGLEKLAADLDLLSEQGIRAVVSLTERPLVEEVVQAKEMAYLHLPIVDMQSPTLEDVVRCMDFVKKVLNESRPVAVHCGAGMGRTGTILACYLVEQGCGAQDALAQVRQSRPGSVETLEQEAVVHEYVAYLKTFARQPV